MISLGMNAQNPQNGEEDVEDADDSSLLVPHTANLP